MVPVDPPQKIFPQEDLQHQILELSLPDQEMLLAWLKATVKERKQQETLQIPLKKGREVVDILSTGTTTYRLEKVKCGKKKCKCNKGKLHGPYWYSYHWNGKKLSSSYIGKALPDQVSADYSTDHSVDSSVDSKGPVDIAAVSMTPADQRSGDDLAMLGLPPDLPCSKIKMPPMGDENA